MTQYKTGQIVKVIATEDELRSLGIKDNHIKHIHQKQGTIKTVVTLYGVQMCYIHFPHIRLKAKEGNRQPYYVLPENYIQLTNMEMVGVENEGQ